MPNYYNGDITLIDFPTNALNFIPQVCNNIGKYGAGLSGALSAKWPKIEQSFSQWVIGEGKGCSGPYELGHIQMVSVTPSLAIVNMIAQKGVRARYNPKPLQYKQLEMCLIRLFANLSQISCRFADGHIKIWCPKIGAGLAGGDWDNIQERISHWFDRPEFELNYVFN